MYVPQLWTWRVKYPWQGVGPSPAQGVRVGAGRLVLGTTGHVGQGGRVSGWVVVSALDLLAIIIVSCQLSCCPGSSQRSLMRSRICVCNSDRGHSFRVAQHLSVMSVCLCVVPEAWRSAWSERGRIIQVWKRLWRHPDILWISTGAITLSPFPLFLIYKTNLKKNKKRTRMWMNSVAGLAKLRSTSLVCRHWKFPLLCSWLDFCVMPNFFEPLSH